MWTPQERFDVINQLRNLSKIYPRKLDAETIDAYCEAIAPTSPDALRRGIRDLIAERVKGVFPTPGEILSYSRQYNQRPRQLGYDETPLPLSETQQMKFCGTPIRLPKGKVWDSAIKAYNKNITRGLTTIQFCEAMVSDMLADGISEAEPMIEEYRNQIELERGRV